jgi:glycine dehydrogenase subunit 1
MSFVPHTDLDRVQMLERIGVERLEDLFADLPAGVRFPDLSLPQPGSELEVERELREIASGAARGSQRPGFLGAGAARHWVPPTVDAVLRRGELFSAYTPYQPELSQGFLQATFEYQTMMCELTGMDVSTASHYDGSVALAEAALMALSAGGAARGAGGGRRKLFVSPNLDPRYREVLATYLANTDAEIVSGAACEPDASTAACIVQSPNYFGQLEAVPALAEAAHAAGALLIVVPDPVSLGLLQSPGEEGADLVAADGVGLGIPPSFGGPHLGILAVKRAHMRRTPGRLVGETVDAAGERGYVLTLGTREQHIRREKATSNICTNQGLLALRATVYMSLLGENGLGQLARVCCAKAHDLAERIAEVEGYRLHFGAPFFREFVVECPVDATDVAAVARLDGLLAGIPLERYYGEAARRLLLVAVTEKHLPGDFDQLVAALRAARR